MPSTLYLDAARMGLMAPSAQWALHDFVRLAGEEGCTLYFEQFFQVGFSAWPADLQKRFPGLRCWGGIRELKQRLANFVGLPDASQTILAGRSTNLMKVAEQLLVRGAGPLLVTDLVWPSYARILARKAQCTTARIEQLCLREGILSRHISNRELVQAIVSGVERTRCGSIFLPAVSHDGIRLPIAEIASEIRRLDSSVVIVIDGSQALGQIPIDLSQIPCDFFFGGCHKWLASHLPLGIAFCPNPATQSIAGRAVRGDPIAAFLQGMESRRPGRFTETVNLSPLFSCRGALEDQLAGETQAARFRHRRAIAEMVVRIGRMTGWTPLVPSEDFRSAAILLQATSPQIRRLTPQTLRERLHELGVALTCYHGGVIRLSAPIKPFSRNEAGTLIQALVLVQTRASCRESAEARSA